MREELTHPPNGEGDIESSLPLERELIYWIEWLIKLRWLAVLMLVVITAGMRFFLRIPVPLVPLLLIGTVVGIYNIIFTHYAHRVRELQADVHTFHNFANFQISVDWIALIFLIHYTGGVESPLIFYFVLHIVVSAILLSRKNCFLQAVFASLLIVIIALAEYRGVISHISSPVLLGNFYNHLPSVITYLFFFITGFLIIAYLASSVSTRLRERERMLVVLEQNLEKAYHHLEEADKAKSQFVTMITHELRSPISTIESILDRLQGGVGGDLSSKQIEYLDRMQRRTNYILTLVNDLLHLTAEEREVRRERRPVDMKEVLRGVCESVQTLVEQKRLDFRVEMDSPPLWIRGDEEEIELLFSNLISNAIKYTPEEGRVGVKLIKEDRVIKVEVSDTGIGIPREDQEKIFQEFYRAPNAKKLIREGTGLGLPIVKRIVESYGGRIEVQSEPGKGCKFSCNLKEKSVKEE